MRSAVAAVVILFLAACAAMAQSIEGSYVEPLEPSELVPDETHTLLVYVFNSSIDLEWIREVEITVPGVSVVHEGTGGYEPGWSAPWSFDFSGVNDDHTGLFVDGDGDWGEIYDGDGGNFFFDFTFHGSTHITFSWTLRGDGYGDEPHSVSGTFDIPIGFTATEATTWGAVKSLYR